jgi:hypothetical protein
MSSEDDYESEPEPEPNVHINVKPMRFRDGTLYINSGMWAVNPSYYGCQHCHNTFAELKADATLKDNATGRITPYHGHFNYDGDDCRCRPARPNENRSAPQSDDYILKMRPLDNNGNYARNIPNITIGSFPIKVIKAIEPIIMGYSETTSYIVDSDFESDSDGRSNDECESDSDDEGENGDDDGRRNH